MRSIFRTFIFSLTIACSGCVSNMLDGSHGVAKLALLGDSAVQMQFDRLSETRVSGKGCFDMVAAPALMLNDLAYQRAIEEALAKVPDASSLADVVITDHGECVEVTGIPARPHSSAPASAVQ
jgi:hypothetical protein